MKKLLLRLREVCYMDSFYLILFNIIKFLTKITPSFILNFFVNSLAYLISLSNNKHRRVAELNLDIAFLETKTKEEKKEIIKNAYKNLLWMLVDFIRNQGTRKQDILSKVDFINEEYIVKALQDKRKIIFVTAHYGNWELIPLSIAAKFTPLSVVGRDLDSKVMNEILTANRVQFDVELLSKKGAMKGMVGSLLKDRPIGILVDQNTNDKEGVIVDFFGKKVRHTPSVALLAKKFNALIIPIFMNRNLKNKYELTFYKPFEFEDSGNKEDDIINCVQKQANITQEIISKRPDEWFWFHKRWKYTHENQYK